MNASDAAPRGGCPPDGIRWQELIGTMEQAALRSGQGERVSWACTPEMALAIAGRLRQLAQLRALLERQALERALFVFLDRKYTQRQDSRQRAMGLQYMDAETHDLAYELSRYLGMQARQIGISLNEDDHE